MARKAKMQGPDLTQYYTAAQAAEVLTKNSGRTISPAYVRTMARAGLVTPFKVTDRLSFYPKSEIDTYVVRSRGQNLTSEGRAKRTQEQ